MKTQTLGSEIFETSIVKTDEAFLLIKAATEAGTDLETAYEDMKMIDDILHLKKIHFVVHGHIKKTQAGYFRKGSSLYDGIDRIINNRCKNPI